MFEPVSHDATTEPHDIIDGPKDGNDAAGKLLAIQQEFRVMESGYQKTKQRAILQIYGIACYLRDDSQAWADFCERSEWKEYARAPSSKDHSPALRYALLLAIGFSRAAAKDVSRYFRILRSQFERGESVLTVEKRIDEAGGLIPFGKCQMSDTPKPSSGTDDRRVWSSDTYENDANRLRDRNPLADRGVRKADVQGVLDEIATFHQRNVIVPRRLAREAKGLICLRVLMIAVWLALDRDAWDEFCRSEVWIGRKQKPNLSRREKAFHFVLLFLDVRLGMPLKSDPLYVLARGVWREIFKRSTSAKRAHHGEW